MAAPIAIFRQLLPRQTQSLVRRVCVPASARLLFHTTASRNDSTLTRILTPTALAPDTPSQPLVPTYVPLPHPILQHSKIPPPIQKSQAVLTPHAIYVSGQLPSLPSGDLVSTTTAAKTEACINNVAAILIAAGSGLDKIVKVQVFLTNMSDYDEMNKVYEKLITHRPARSCVAVKELPKGVSIEIDCVALPGEGEEDLSAIYQGD